MQGRGARNTKAASWRPASERCRVDLIVEAADSEQMPTIIARLEAARAALETIHGV